MPPLRGDPVRISGWNLSYKNYRDGATVWWKLHDPNFNRFRLIYPCDGRTDRWTDSIENNTMSSFVNTVLNSFCCREQLQLRFSYCSCCRSINIAEGGGRGRGGNSLPQNSPKYIFNKNCAKFLYISAKNMIGGLQWSFRSQECLPIAFPKMPQNTF